VLFRSPPQQYTDVEAQNKTEEFIATYGGKSVEVNGNGQKPAKRVLAKESESASDGNPRITLPKGKKTTK
jgi:hypothetical protein